MMMFGKNTASIKPLSIAKYTYSDLTPSQSKLIWRIVQSDIHENTMYGGNGYASSEQVGNVTTVLVFDAGHAVARHIYEHLKNDPRICKFDYYYKEEW